MTAVEGLATREASGILKVTGSPAGAIYLDGGRVVFARASWVPGLTARLRGLRPAPGGLPDLPSGKEADDAAIAGAALERGYLTPAGLHELVRSIVVDAFLVLTIPLAAEYPVADIRFTAMRSRWADMFPRLGVDLVRREALSAAERIADYGLTPTMAVTRCELREPVAVLTREQWTVACQIGSHVSARELAARRGAALKDTLECLGSLVTAGLCAPVRLPARRTVRDHPWGDRPADPGQPPPPDVLRQVLNGLRNL
jgi:hypothetical protein